MRKIRLLIVLLLSVLALLLSTGSVFADKGRGDCKLTVPPNPLSAKGLSTPWMLSNGAAICHEGDPGTAVFVQATIFSPTTKSLFVYSPLVIDAGTSPAIAPVVPALPADAVVGLFGGGNDGTTRLIGNDADVAQCQNGEPHPFGQVFYCGTPALFTAMERAGVTVPDLGTAADGLPCPTVRDFAIVDQDQSDNVQTQYLVTTNGHTAQDTAANRASLGTFVVAKNPSDNRVLTNGVDVAFGCHPWTAPDLANGGRLAFSQALDEYQANAYQLHQALVPAGDPMVMVNGAVSLEKINEYRLGMHQPLAATLAQASTLTYCKSILATAPARLANNESLLAAQPSPVPSVASNLWTFMAQRLSFTLSGATGQGLNCTGMGLPNPVHLTISNGVTVAASIDPPKGLALSLDH